MKMATVNSVVSQKQTIHPFISNFSQLGYSL